MTNCHLNIGVLSSSLPAGIFQPTQQHSLLVLEPLHNLRLVIFKMVKVRTVGYLLWDRARAGGERNGNVVVEILAPVRRGQSLVLKASGSII